jgi:hypothetical protein
MVSTRDVEGPATGVCGKSDGVGNTERSHMIAVESSDDETRYRLFRDQLVSVGFDSATHLILLTARTWPSRTLAMPRVSTSHTWTKPSSSPVAR